MSEREALQTIVDAVFKAAPGQITVEANLKRIIEYFGDEKYDPNSIDALAGGTVAPIIILHRLVKDLQFQVQELETRLRNDGK
jgi:hypothetical protein